MSDTISISGEVLVEAHEAAIGVLRRNELNPGQIVQACAMMGISMLGALLQMARANGTYEETRSNIDTLLDHDKQGLEALIEKLKKENKDKLDG